MGLILPTDDVVGINERVRLGDPVAGWRGDPEMLVYLDEDTQMCNVVATDARGDRYVAASTSVVDPGWRHDLLCRLRDGDWRRSDVVARQSAKVDAAQAVADMKVEEELDEHAEKLAWALRRDAGHAVGLSKEFY